MAAANERGDLARIVTASIENAVGIGVDLTVFSDAEKTSELRRLAERNVAPDWANKRQRSPDRSE